MKGVGGVGRMEGSGGRGGGLDDFRAVRSRGGRPLGSPFLIILMVCVDLDPGLGQHLKTKGGRGGGGRVRHTRPWLKM